MLCLLLLEVLEALDAEQIQVSPCSPVWMLLLVHFVEQFSVVEVLVVV